MKIHGTYPPTPRDKRREEMIPFTNKELFEIRDALKILIKYYNFVDLYNSVSTELEERQEINLETLNEDRMKEGMK